MFFDVLKHAELKKIDYSIFPAIGLFTQKPKRRDCSTCGLAL
jgi:hypothetical protein